MSSNKKMYPLHRFQRSAIIFNQGVLDDVIISSAGWLGWKAALVYCYLRHHSYSNNVVTLTAEGCRLRYIFIQADHNEDGKLSKIEACPFLQKKTSAQSHVGGGGDASLGMVIGFGFIEIGRRNSGVFQLCGWGLTFDQYKWTIAHESVGHFDMHVATRAFGYCRHITVKRLNEVSMRSPHQILIWTRRSVGITSEAIIRLKKTTAQGLGERLRIGVMVVIRWLYDDYII